MGPLVPDIITTELNLIVALLVGIGFGFIVEQAGFSSSRKLTGLFYGTDFTVLRVFFTAGATAMLGVVALAKLGWLDASLIYVNPAFLPSAIAGGLIMGVGFVVGGYCPGTSFCGASVGRIDAMMFVAGSFLGVVGFGEVFPIVRGFYQSGSLGDVTLPTALGVSPGLVLIATIVVAVVAFIVTGRIERRVNPSAQKTDWPVARHRMAAAVLVLAGVAVGVMPSTRDRLFAAAHDASRRRAHPVATLTADEVAFRILDRDATLLLVDVRPAAAFAKMSLPGAVNIGTSEFFSQASRDILSRADRQVVFLADDDRDAEEAAALASELGFSRVAVLKGGLRGFSASILHVAIPDGGLSGPDKDTWAFRADAAPRIAALIKARGAAKPVQPKAKKIAGGCGV